MKHITIKGSLPLKPRLCSLKGDTEVKKENVRVLKGRVKVGWNVCCIPKKYSLCSLHSFPCGSAGKESACSVGGLGLIPGLGRSPGEGKGCPLQYSGLENSMDCSWGRKELDTTE